mmetsp:Transcript_308/g.369  ORF Transcript_308/g.369 Transcript_308/m.369 type:complete len:905 (-) Transcript_308:326-3040(-)
MTSQMLPPPDMLMVDDFHRPNGDGILPPSSPSVISGLEQSPGQPSKLETDPKLEFEPELVSESETDTDPGAEQEIASMQKALGIITKEAQGQRTKTEHLVAVDSTLSPAETLTPPPPIRGSFGLNQQGEDVDSGGNSSEAVFWEGLKANSLPTSISRASAVKAELEEIRRKKIAKSLLSERSLRSTLSEDEENRRRAATSVRQSGKIFSPQSFSNPTSTAAYLSQVEFYLNQRARSEEQKRKQRETMEMWHSYRNKNVEQKKDLSPVRPTQEEEWKHSYTPTASPYGTSPRAALKPPVMPSSYTLSPLREDISNSEMDITGSDLSYADVDALRQDFERRMMQDAENSDVELNFADVDALKQNIETRMSEFSPTTQKSVRQAISSQQFEDDILNTPETNEKGDAEFWDEKSDGGAPVLPFTMDDIEQPSGDDALSATKDDAEEKVDGENSHAAEEDSKSEAKDANHAEEKVGVENIHLVVEEDSKSKAKDDNHAEEKVDRENSRAAKDSESRRSIANEEEVKTKAAQCVIDKECAIVEKNITVDREAKQKETQAPSRKENKGKHRSSPLKNPISPSEKSLSNTQQSAKKERGSKNKVEKSNTPNTTISPKKEKGSPQKNPKKEKGSFLKSIKKKSSPRQSAKERGGKDKLVIKKTSIKSAVKITSPRSALLSAKKEKGLNNKHEQKTPKKIKSPECKEASSKQEVEQDAKKSKSPRKTPRKTTTFFNVPRCATVTKTQATRPEISNRTPQNPPRTPPRPHNKPGTPLRKRRCESEDIFPTDSSVCMSLDSRSSRMSLDGRRKKHVPLYNGRSIGVDIGAKRSTLICCERKWDVNMHGSRQGCDRCLHFASDEEKKAFAKHGHHHRIMMTRGGCHRSCSYFPRKKDELPARLCHKCFYDTHELQLW